MKKMVKIAMASLTLSLIVSVMTIKADGFTGVFGIKLPSLSKLTTLTNYQVTKVNDYLEQKYYNTGVTAVFGGDYLPLKVRTKNVDTNSISQFLTLNEKQTGVWKANSANINYFAGKYVLQMKTGKSTVWGGNHSGLWYYDVEPVS